jgi:hypothetical protein
MTIFAVLMPTLQPGLAKRIEDTPGLDFMKISDTQYLVSAKGTAIDLCRELGIYDQKNPQLQPSGNAVVLAMSSYYGRAQATIWEWIKSRLETPPNG